MKKKYLKASGSNADSEFHIIYIYITYICNFGYATNMHLRHLVTATFIITAPTDKSQVVHWLVIAASKKS